MKCGECSNTCETGDFDNTTMEQAVEYFIAKGWEKRGTVIDAGKPVDAFVCPDCK